MLWEESVLVKLGDRWVKDDICVFDSETLKVVEALLRGSGEEADGLCSDNGGTVCLVELSS